MTNSKSCEIDLYQISTNYSEKLEKLSLLKYIIDTIEIKLYQKGYNDENTKYKKILYDDENQQIVLLNELLLDYNMLAIKDTKYNNKFLILFSLKHYYTDYNIFGFIVYFNKECKILEKKIITSVITNYDNRNVTVNNKNIFMYDNHITFIYTHRDLRTFNIDFIKIQEETYENNIDIILKSCYYNNKYSGKIINTNNPRYIVIDTTNKYSDVKQKCNKYIIYDITSLKKITDIKAEINYYDVDYYNDIIDKVVEKDEINEYDGYPLKCIKCNNKTTITDAIYDISEYSNTYNHFGNSFCNKCMIRYSKSSNCWVCCKPIQYNNNINICCEKLSIENNCECTKVHCDVKTEFIIDVNSGLMPPYINKGKIYYNSQNIDKS
jgi:hypothetical protein